MQACFSAAGDLPFLESGIGLIIALGILVLILALALAWIVFPFTVSSKLTDLAEEAKRQTKLLEAIAQNPYRADKPPPEHITEVKHGDGWKEAFRGH